MAQANPASSEAPGPDSAQIMQSPSPNPATFGVNAMPRVPPRSLPPSSSQHRQVISRDRRKGPIPGQPKQESSKYLIPRLSQNQSTRIPLNQGPLKVCFQCLKLRPALALIPMSKDQVRPIKKDRQTHSPSLPKLKLILTATILPAPTQKRRQPDSTYRSKPHRRLLRASQLRRGRAKLPAEMSCSAFRSTPRYK